MVALPKAEPMSDPIAQVKATVRIEDYAENKMGLARKRGGGLNEAWYLCPLHKEDTPSFHIRMEQQTFKCFGCGKGGDVIDLEMAATGETNPRTAAEHILAEYGQRSEPVRMQPLRMPPVTLASVGALSESAVAWLAGRGISKAVAERNAVTGEKNAVTFSYVNEGEIVNRQHRTLSAKGFRFETGKPVIPFGLDDCEGQPEVVIVEGVLDKLSVEEATERTAVLAMPSATPSSDCYALACEAVKDAGKVIIAVDNDEPGHKLRDELIRRIGADRCWVVEWSATHKDANDVLRDLDGVMWVRKYLDAATPLPVEGVFTIDDSWAAIERLYEEGMPAGASTGWGRLDRYYTVRRGQLTVITGTPGSGKSVWADALLMNLAKGSWDWKFAVCSPEMQPLERHWAQFLSLYAGRPFGKGPTERMDRETLRQAKEFIHDTFFMVLPEEPTVEAVTEKFLWTHRRHGVGGLLLDPWNELDHSRPNGMTETEWCNQQLRKLKRVGWNYHVWIGLIAHTTKMYRDKDGRYPVPTLYDINGCYSDDTEYLSRDGGWKRYDEWIDGEQIACFDLESGRLDWRAPTARVEADYEGEMYHWQGSSIDCLVTPNHKMVVRPGWEHEPKNPNDPRIKHRGWQLVRADQVPASLLKTPIAAGRAEPNGWSGTAIFDDMVFEGWDFWHLVGWWVSEGGLMSHGVALSQGEGPVLDEMAATLRRMNVAFTKYIGKPGGNGGTVNGGILRIKKRKHPELSNWLVDKCGAGCAAKRLPSLLWDMGNEAREWVFRALMQGDGTEKTGPKSTPDNWSYSTTSKQLADDICRLAVELGRPARVTVASRREEHHAERYAVSIGREDRKEIYLSAKNQLKKVPYSGKVWCFETPTGAFVTRRNGRVCIQGNSAAFFNKADNGIVVFRDKGDETKPAEIHVQKVRFQEIGGLTGDNPVKLRHDKTTGCYWEASEW